MKLLFKENILPLSEISIGANHTHMRNQQGIEYYLVQLNGKTFLYKIIKKTTWDPHVHGLQELVPHFNDLCTTCWQASSSNQGFRIRRKTKIGCSRVNNILSIKTRELKESDTNDTIGIFTTTICFLN